ncbi:hypothetical protein TREES_T100020456 [Tupaia chinensis]|uniref:Uncharacterized protein n=1 Tax=Tupaia chinensis TaxID=246437 RepID=L9KWE6_TUPCH|nr:hypothetical protein TREES_T100020456 [Tupaia chinensis]
MCRSHSNAAAVAAAAKHSQRLLSSREAAVHTVILKACLLPPPLHVGSHPRACARPCWGEVRRTHLRLGPALPQGLFSRPLPVPAVCSPSRHLLGLSLAVRHPFTHVTAR